MSTTTTHNPRWAEGTQYREFVESLYEEAREAKRARLEAEGKETKKIEFELYLSNPSEWPEVPDPRDKDCWGPWRYKKETLVLEYVPRDRHWWYEVDLERCKTSAQVLDWIFQVSNKHRSRVSAEDIGYLIDALQDLLHPQANLCSFGQDMKFDTTRYLLEGLEDRPLDTKHISKAFDEGRITILTIDDDEVGQ